MEEGRTLTHRPNLPTQGSYYPDQRKGKEPLYREIGIGIVSSSSKNFVGAGSTQVTSDFKITLALKSEIWGDET
ncbi:hypothetical protein HYALB_00007452 [Hymenoscyphus albidus]|uniref:Uncharacterized protein n=1 Tax=Hymenoscyphus albidus TaxID=595503 RepID=A0A9N9QCN1_9HELO|nr:hypothetical protein HYALB_00007452 [Hymenoscyphus albidus]